MLQQADVTVNPLATLDADYTEAVVSLAWAVDRDSRARILVCATVELLPCELPPPLLLGERGEKISSRLRVYVRDIVVSAKRGVVWFDDAARGSSIRPTEDGALGDATDASTPTFVTGQFEQEPAPPSMLTTNTRPPFAADRDGSIRIRHLVTDQSPFRGWTDAERDKAIAWLKSETDVDLGVFPELAGSIHLVAPNPIFRTLFVRCDRDDYGRSSLLLAVTPRTGRSVAGLDLILEEQRATGTGLVRRVALTGPLTRIQLPYRPGQVRERVVDEQRGLLHEGSLGVFGVGFNLSVHLASDIRRVEPNGPNDAYEVSLVGGFRTASHVPPTSPEQAAATLLAGAQRDRERAQRGAACQRWFRDRAPDAVKALRDLVGPAKVRVFICDPYFGGDDLLRVVLAVADAATAVRLLTSAEHLRRPRDSGSEGEYLRLRLDDARRAPPINDIAIHVMPGRRAPIHDRFLLADDQMWMLGASINGFGERGTLMLVVPDPRPVLDELQRVWDGSPPLTEWLATRRATGEEGA